MPAPNQSYEGKSVEDLLHLSHVHLANGVNGLALWSARRIMAHTGLDPEASTRSEGPLSNGHMFDSKVGKVVHAVERTPLVPVGVVLRSRTASSSLESLRLVEERTEYHSKKPFVPSLFGGLAVKRSDFSVFYVETFVGGENTRDAVRLPIDPARVYSGNVGPAASDENIARGLDVSLSFMKDLAEMAKALEIGLPPPSARA
jgi:hypothetical protein